MPVEKTEGGGFVVTGEAINLYSLIALRGALQLESKGFRRSRRSARTIACERLGLKGRPRIETVLRELDAKIEQLKAEGAAKR
jgi:hypothetical protein